MERFAGFHDHEGHPFDRYPKHLYHEGLPAFIAHNKTEETEARAKGYGDDYIPQDYPKQLAGNRIANNAEEEAAILASLAPPVQEQES